MVQGVGDGCGREADFNRPSGVLRAVLSLGLGCMRQPYTSAETDDDPVRKHFMADAVSWRRLYHVGAIVSVVYLICAALLAPRVMEELLPYWLTRLPPGILFAVFTWGARRKHGHAQAVVAALQAGNDSTISSAIAAQGDFTRDLLLSDAQTTELNQRRRRKWPQTQQHLPPQGRSAKL
jgi:hypothetical protein